MSLPGFGFAVAAYWGGDDHIVTQFIDATGAASGATLTLDPEGSHLFRNRGLNLCLLPSGDITYVYRVAGPSALERSNLAYAVLGCP